MFRFKCAKCDEWHEGVPSFGADAPLYYYAIPEIERTDRCKLDADTCVVDSEYFFIKGCLEIPVRGVEEAFSWGVWVSLSYENFKQYLQVFDKPSQANQGPYFGWLSAAIKGYPDTENLKTRVHLRDHGIRPYIELEPTDHPLAVEQREGISVERLADIYAVLTH